MQVLLWFPDLLGSETLGCLLVCLNSHSSLLSFVCFPQWIGIVLLFISLATLYIDY